MCRVHRHQEQGSLELVHTVIYIWCWRKCSNLNSREFVSRRGDIDKDCLIIPISISTWYASTPSLSQVLQSLLLDFKGAGTAQALTICLLVSIFLVVLRFSLSICKAWANFDDVTDRHHLRELSLLLRIKQGKISYVSNKALTTAVLRFQHIFSNVEICHVDYSVSKLACLATNVSRRVNSPEFDSENILSWLWKQNSRRIFD
jgi:hypothetical protein